MKKSLLIILLSGKEDGGRRATIAFSMAVSALCSEIDTTVFLTGDGAIWAEEKRSEEVHVDGFEKLSKYMNDFVELKGKLLACYTCSKFSCSTKEEGEDGTMQPKVNPHLNFVGFPTIVDLAVEASVMSF